MTGRTSTAVDYRSLGDFDLARLCAARNRGAIHHVISSNNQRMFRAAWSILRNRAEAEECVQAAYLAAFAAIGTFEGRSALSTWLTRIVVNEALGRLRRRKPAADLSLFDNIASTQDDTGIVPFPLAASQPDPERAMAQTEIQTMLEKAIDALPDAFRVVLVARVIEEMSVEETADLYGLKPETVKTRLHRARTMLRENLEQKFGPMLTNTFPFGGQRCERMADRIIERLTGSI
jgi:RNA polymerase sigma-70 factor (ECF subfamily)